MKTRNSGTISDYDIQAFVDNELDDDEARAVVEYIKVSPRARERYQSLLKQKAILDRWWSNISHM